MEEATPMGHDRRLYQPRDRWVTPENYVRAITLIAAAVLLLCASTLLLTQEVAAQVAVQADISPRSDSDGCGQVRVVLVRFADGQPAPGVTLTMSARDTAAGGPELYAPVSSGIGVDGDQDVVEPPLTPPSTRCSPVITGTLTATTDRSGLARFSGLGEGNWMLRFDGRVTRSGKTAAVVPSPVQGLFPYGRTREGGGFVERVDALNEHGGPNPAPVQPGTGPTTSRYVLHFSVEHNGWLPGIDLATVDGAPPIPLAAVTPTSAGTPEPTPDGGTPGGAMPVSGDVEPQQSNSPGEFAFDRSCAGGVPSRDQAPAEPGGQPGAVRTLNLWWTVVLIVLIAALSILVLMWARRRARVISPVDRQHMNDGRRR
jgi:hypothetical protein